MPKISVIIPVYNAENYLKRCLDSVCNQTLQDIEIICINDFSTDNSLLILNKYSQDFTNLKIINLTKNCGESLARNTGISFSKGEYLAFVDNDDEIDLNFYEILYNKAKDSDLDIVKGQAVEISYNGKKTIVKQTQESDKMFFLTYWWTAIYKRSVVIENNISFSENHVLGGDLLFLNQSLIASKSFGVVREVYYHYYRRKDSGDSEILSEEKIISALGIFTKIIDNINSNISYNKVVYGFIFHHFIMSCFYLSLRTSDKRLKKICTENIISFFAKCQNKLMLKDFFFNTAPNLLELLEKQDHNEVENVVLKCKSRIELIASGLRSKMKK